MDNSLYEPGRARSASAATSRDEDRCAVWPAAGHAIGGLGTLLRPAPEMTVGLLFSTPWTDVRRLCFPR